MSRKITCPQCFKKHDALVSDEASKWPTAAEYSRSLHRNQALIQLLPESSKVALCSELGCTAEATHYCSTRCGLLCADCEKSAHPRSSKHKRSSVTNQQKKKQLSLDAAAADRKAAHPSFIAAVESLETKLQDVVAREQELHSQHSAPYCTRPGVIVRATELNSCM
jgi:hypothetical protein